MPILYNCRHSGDQYRITKFDSDMNPQGSYLLSLEECECPASVRPTCRHRQMLPKFIARGHVGDEWFFDFDRGGWVQGEAYWGVGPAITQGAVDLPEGVTMILMDSPNKIVDVHNAIAEAVGEPKLGGFPDWCLVEQCITQEDCILNGCIKGHGSPLKPPSPTHIKRRF